jgi:PhnB protein
MPEYASEAIQPIPYLSFDGNCAEAMKFYAEVFGGTSQVMMTAGDTPMAGETPPEMKDRIMNAQLQLPGGSWLYGGDAWGEYKPVTGVTITLNFDTVERAEEIFNALSVGG